MSTPSPRSQAIYEFLRSYWEETGTSPSSREIQEAFGFRSQTAAMNHLRQLTQSGWVRPLAGRGRTRGWAPAHQENPPRPATESFPPPARYQLPILGSIAAGFPEANLEQSEEFIPIDLEGLALPNGGKFFGLKVRGDSMIGAHIQPGDIVVMEFRPPKHRDIVAALIDGETTLKRLLMQKGRPFLRAENPAYPSLIPAQELVIQGVLVALLRQY
jgi:repressor LexA